MEKKHFVDGENNYLGIYLHGAVPPEGAKEVTEPPSRHHIYNGEEWVYDEATHWENIRRERDWLLVRTDMIAALPDHPKLQEVLDYRQALRDLPDAFENPNDVVWPASPLEG